MIRANQTLLEKELLQLNQREKELSAKIQSGEIQVHDYTTDSTCPGA